MDRKSQVTIVDVARHARVSAGTVSNVLTVNRPVAASTRKRVLRAVEELCYRPNLLARSLVNRSSNTIGVVAYGLEYYGPSRTLVGMEQQAAELGYSLLLDLLHRPDGQDVDVVLEGMMARQVDGIIWAVHEVGDTHGWVTEARLLTLPPMLFLTMEPRVGTTMVATDNRAGARLAVQHLIDAGRRTIGILCGPMAWWEVRERLAGWRGALDLAGLEASPDLVVEADWSAAGGERAVFQLLQRRPDLDAIFACNDSMALGVLHCCHRRHCSVPGELSVVGFDDTPESAFFWPPLTTVHQPLAELGRAAVDQLHRQIELRLQGEEPEPPTVQWLFPSLKVRKSCGAAL